MTVSEFESLLFQPAFLVFLALSFGESIDLMWSNRRTVMTYVMVCSLCEFYCVFDMCVCVFMCVLVHLWRSDVVKSAYCHDVCHGLLFV